MSGGRQGEVRLSAGNDREEHEGRIKRDGQASMGREGWKRCRKDGRKLNFQSRTSAK